MIKIIGSISNFLISMIIGNLIGGYLALQFMKWNDKRIERKRSKKRRFKTAIATGDYV